MVEVNLIYEFLPGMDQSAYMEWAKKAIGQVLRSPGVVEFRASRNLLGSPQVRTTTVWQALADWANFVESLEWQALESELRGSFAGNISIELWGPSPVVPEPLRPGK